MMTEQNKDKILQGDFFETRSALELLRMSAEEREQYYAQLMKRKAAEAPLSDAERTKAAQNIEAILEQAASESASTGLSPQQQKKLDQEILEQARMQGKQESEE